MTRWKKLAGQAAGYTAFFLAAFVVFFYLGFDPNLFSPALAKGLEQFWPPLRNKKVTIEDLRLRRLVSLEARGIKIASPGTTESPGPALVIDRLILSPRLLSLPAMIRALRNGSAPVISLSSFTAHLAGGKIKGELDSTPKSFRFRAEIKHPLSLNKITLPSNKLKDLTLEGLLTGSVQFEYPDLQDPNTGQGAIALEWDQPAIKNLKVVGLEDLRMDKGTLVVKLQGAAITIETLKLQGEDLPLNLQGTITLKDPFRQSLIDIKGPLQQGESFKTKNPLAAAFLPNNKNFAFNGTLDALFPGLF